MWQLKRVVCTVTRVLWAQAVLSEYALANTPCFAKSPRVKWADEFPAAQVQDKNSASEHGRLVQCTTAADAEAPAGSGGAASNGAAFNGAAPRVKAESADSRLVPLGPQNAQVLCDRAVGVFPEARIAANLCKVWALWVDDGDQAKAVGEHGSPGARSDLFDERILAMLHEFFLGLQLVDRTIEHLIAAAGGEEGSWGEKRRGEVLTRLKQRSRLAFAQQQLLQSQRRCTDYVSEICDASADLALGLEQGIFEEESGFMISLGNSQQRFVVDVLLDQDVVAVCVCVCLCVCVCVRACVCSLYINIRKYKRWRRWRVPAKVFIEKVNM
jgi:hypothetical protein